MLAANLLADTESVDQDSAPRLAAEFHHFGVSVTDLDRSLDFYCHVLGAVVLFPPHSVDEFNFRRVIVWLKGSMCIDLNEHAANLGEPFDPSRTGLDHLAFGVCSYDALASWAGHLDVRGVAHSQIRAIAGVGETFDFRDPDGIQLELWHHDPNGVWASTVQKLEQPGA